jgi:hypothetical protein
MLMWTSNNDPDLSMYETLVLLTHQSMFVHEVLQHRDYVQICTVNRTVLNISYSLLRAADAFLIISFFDCLPNQFSCLCLSLEINKRGQNRPGWAAGISEMFKVQNLLLFELPISLSFKNYTCLKHD